VQIGFIGTGRDSGRQRVWLSFRNKSMRWRARISSWAYLFGVIASWLPAEVGCVAKTIPSAKPNQQPISAVDYSAFNPRISWMNWICPRTSRFGKHLTWPFRIMCRTS